MSENRYEMARFTNEWLPYSTNIFKRILRHDIMQKNVFFKARNIRKLFYLNYNIQSSENDKM